MKGVINLYRQRLVSRQQNTTTCVASNDVTTTDGVSRNFYNGSIIAGVFDKTLSADCADDVKFAVVVAVFHRLNYTLLNQTMHKTLKHHKQNEVLWQRSLEWIVLSLSSV